ncbi:MAG TPA: hypothetical protein VHU13_06965 [Solirubrobacteraceae bacterium]|jgi:hypothetical protein|nr:hypothetical protein [Solirubrobacteraceae bacterium]
MAMAERWHEEPREAQSSDERARLAEQRAQLAEEQRLQAEGRCFAAERRRLDAERQLEQVQRLLAQARRSGVRMQAIVVELGALAAHLRSALEPGQRPEPAKATEESDRRESDQRAEMADALAAAVERLRARVAAVEEIEPEQVPAPIRAAHSPAPTRPPHKHSMSALTRWRNRWRNARKQRQAA